MDPQNDFSKGEGPIYQHTPLKNAKQEIRLLVLHPGKSFDDVYVTFQPITPGIKLAVKFQALSYRRELQLEHANILVEFAGHRIRTRILEQELRSLRLPDSPRLIWIDILCINEKDTCEQVFQIECMPRIYVAASNTSFLQLQKIRLRVSRKMLERRQLMGRSRMSGWSGYHSGCLTPLSPAKEAPQFPIINLSPTLVELKHSENKNYSGPGDSQMIRNSSVLCARFGKFLYNGIFRISKSERDYYCDGFSDLAYVNETHESSTSGYLNERIEELVNLPPPVFHARIGKLFDRDYVWVVTQTMVSFAYKVYPSFWGRMFVRCSAYKVYPGFWVRMVVRCSA